MELLIDIKCETRTLLEQEFRQMAEVIIGFAFSAHNRYGRLMSEDIYKRFIQAQCLGNERLPARREVEIAVRHLTFQKSFFIDLLIADGLIVEAKTVESLTNDHFVFLSRPSRFLQILLAWIPHLGGIL